MLKLIRAYLAKPTYKNAQKVRAYERAHPMSMCCLEAGERAALADAIYHANQGHTRREPSNERLAAALNESGVFKPFTCIGEDDETAPSKYVASPYSYDRD